MDPQYPQSKTNLEATALFCFECHQEKKQKQKQWRGVVTTGAQNVLSEQMMMIMIVETKCPYLLASDV